MKINDADIELFVSQNQCMLFADDRWYATDANMKYDEHSLYVTMEQLVKLDARLEYVIPSLAESTKGKGGLWKRAGEKPVLAGALLRGTLDYWKNLFHVLEIDGSAVAVKEVSMFDPEMNKSENDTVLIQLMLFELKTCNDGSGKNIEYVHRFSFSNLDVSKIWMAQTYPGWEKRFNVMSALGYDRAHMYKSVFPPKGVAEVPQQLSDVALPDILLPDS